MYFTYHEIKETLFVLETVFGALMLVAAFHLLNIMNAAIEPLAYLLPAVVLVVTGIGCLVFGIWTYHFKNDPDLWH
jgi:hypothetical protein